MDDAAWDSVLDVEAQHVERGRAEGAVFGLEKAATEAREAGRKQGRAFGMELGFYASVVRVLGVLQREQAVRAAWAERAEAAGATDRAVALRAAVTGGLLDKESTLSVLAALQALLAAFPVGAAFTEEVHTAFLKIRAKFRILENRLGVVLDITPPLAPTASAAGAGSLDF